MRINPSFRDYQIETGILAREWNKIKNIEDKDNRLNQTGEIAVEISDLFNQANFDPDLTEEERRKIQSNLSDIIELDYSRRHSGDIRDIPKHYESAAEVYYSHGKQKENPKNDRQQKFYRWLNIYFVVIPIIIILQIIENKKRKASASQLDGCG